MNINCTNIPAIIKSYIKHTALCFPQARRRDREKAAERSREYRARKKEEGTPQVKTRDASYIESVVRQCLASTPAFCTSSPIPSTSSQTTPPPQASQSPAQANSPLATPVKSLRRQLGCADLTSTRVQPRQRQGLYNIKYKVNI